MTTVYFFSIWHDYPQRADAKLFYVTEQEIEMKHGVEPAAFIDQVCHLDNQRFVAVEVLEDLVPTCLCCHAFGERHKDMAALYFWAVENFARVKPMGWISGKDPAPLDKDDIEFVFEQLQLHPEYRAQQITMASCDSEVITLNGSAIQSLPIQ